MKEEISIQKGGHVSTGGWTTSGWRVGIMYHPSDMTFHKLADAKKYAAEKYGITKFIRTVRSIGPRELGVVVYVGKDGNHET